MIKKILPYKKTKIMGIINATPDSFSGDGLLTQENPIEITLAQAKSFYEAGANILDIGAESTRPGSTAIGEQEEITRIIPIIKAIRTNHPEIVISVDTYKARVAEQAIQAGANWINDVWGLRADPDMAKIASKYQANTIIMHNHSKPNNAQMEADLGGRYIGIKYNDLLNDVKLELMESVEIALTAGLSRDKIILDPGIGFGKTVKQNLELINRLDEIKQLGFPVLLGPSRKSFIGYTLKLPVEDRLEGTIAAVVFGIFRGADIVRVHDVIPISKAVRMTDALLSLNY